MQTNRPPKVPGKWSLRWMLWHLVGVRFHCHQEDEYWCGAFTLNGARKKLNAHYLVAHPTKGIPYPLEFGPKSFTEFIEAADLLAGFAVLVYPFYRLYWFLRDGVS